MQIACVGDKRDIYPTSPFSLIYDYIEYMDCVLYNYISSFICSSKSPWWLMTELMKSDAQQLEVDNE